ncbi:MAG TPA: nitroreductase family protein [Firmicutes bacterium]|nr:nitroreductase family protein [Bacillota bacterium]
MNVILSKGNDLMKDGLETILTRRSIRSFTNEPLDEATIKSLLHAGMSAPSAHNRRPFHFITILDETTRLALKNKSMFAKMLDEAPLVIAVCGDKVRQPIHDFLIEDCSAATENILLAAHALDLGAVWIGVYTLTGWQKFIINTLELPKNILPIALIAIGHPKQTRKDRERFEDDKWHHEKW